MPTPEEKEELLRWGAMFDHNIDGVMEVVKPETYRKWLRQNKKKMAFKKSGNAILVSRNRRLPRTQRLE